MKADMMGVPLTPLHFLRRAARIFPEKEVVSVDEGSRARHGWGRIHERVLHLVGALRSLGVEPGDRVASLAWNHHRHVELYFGVPGAEAVLHTVNARLAPPQVARILDHAGSNVVFADAGLAPLVDEASAHRDEPPIRVALSGEPPAGWRSYEALLAEAEPVESLPEPDEEDAVALCYTSGTTGEPKGVLYSHRAVALHTLGICLPDGFGLGEGDVILPAVPMFHANAWGLVHAAAMTGATLVLPGVRPGGELLADLLAEEQVTFAAGVPTVWMDVLRALRERPRSLATGLRIHAGGAPTPPSLLEAYRTELGVEILAGWGMTELTPVGMVAHPRGAMADAPPEELLDVRTSQGTPLPFVETRVVDDEGREVPADGTTAGELEVRGPWVTAGYFRRPSPERFHEGWLRTGDVATVDADGYVRLVDRTKDLIRSGGEWISSVQLEHALMDHADVEEAGVVAVPHPRWQERPWACVVLRAGWEGDPEALLEPLRRRFPEWWLPDRVLVRDRLPRTATGKLDKKALREELAGEA